MGRNQIVQRRLRAAFLVRNAGERQRHFGRRQRAHHHGVVDVTEMADAEILAGIGAEARAVGDVEVLQRQRAELVGATVSPDAMATTAANASTR